jgi:predicted transcriptional regulator
MTMLAGGDMSAALEVPLPDETRERLKEIAARSRKSEAEIAATLIEGALAADELEAEIIRKRLAQADAGGPFVRHEDVLAWLKALSDGRQVPPPRATTSS